MAPIVPIAVALGQEFLPEIVGRIAGKRREAVAERVVKAATDLIGKRPTGSAEAVDAIKAEPGLSTVMRMELAEIEREEYAAEVQDRISAREYHARAGTQAPVVAFAAGALILIVIVAAALVYVESQGFEAAQAIAYLTTVGGLAVLILKDVAGFVFGSSVGSKEKDAVIGRVAERQERRQEPPVAAPAPPPVPEPAVAPPVPSQPRTRDLVGEIMAM